MGQQRPVLDELLSALSKDRHVLDDVLTFIREKGIDPDKLTLHQLREVVAAYTRSVLLKLKTGFDQLSDK